MIVTFTTEHQGGEFDRMTSDVVGQLATWGYSVLFVDWNFAAGPSGQNGVAGLVADRLDPLHVVTRVDLPGGGSLDTIPGGAADRLPSDQAEWERAYAGGLGDFLEDCAEQWRTAYEVVVIRNGAPGEPSRGIPIAHLSDAVVVDCHGGEAAALRTASEGRDLLPYGRAQLLVLPVNGVVEEFERWTLTWVHASVRPERVVELAVGDVRVLAALLVNEFAGTGLLVADPMGYVFAAENRDGVLEAARAVRPQLTRLAPEAGDLDQTLRDLLATHPTPVARLRDVLASDEAVETWVTKLLADPEFRPVEARPGPSVALPVRHACPVDGNYVWYRHGTEAVPTCREHPVVLEPQQLYRRIPPNQSNQSTADPVGESTETGDPGTRSPAQFDGEALDPHATTRPTVEGAELADTLTTSGLQRAAFAGGIFVNYRQTRIAVDGRRVLCAHAQLVEAIVERLGRHFGRDQVFMDTEMRPSSRYPTELRDRLAKSELVIAVIHDRWLADLDSRAGGAERDWVRFELATALGGGKHVLPVLIDTAGLPGGAELPADLTELVLRQAHRVRFGHWRQDLDRLIQHAELYVAPRPLPEPEDKPAPPVRSWRGLAAAAVLGLLAPYAVTRLTGVDPLWLTAFAIVLPVLLFVPAVILGASFAARGWLDTLDGHAAATAHDTRTNVVTGLSIGGIAILVLLVNDFFPPEVGLLSVAVVAMFGVSMGATWLREHRTAPEWPKPALAADTSAIRGALARVRRHLDEHPAPLTRHQRDQARFALDQIRRAHERLQDQSKLGRRAWLRTASPWLTWTHATLSGAAAGTAVGAYLLHSETGGHNAVALALAAGAVVLACCLHLAAVEFAYLWQRWQRAKVVAEVPPALDELEERLRENSVQRPSDGHLDR